MIAPDERMSALLAEIVPLALGAAISPVIFLLQLTTLTGPRAIARGSALIIESAGQEPDSDIGAG
jgi:hypothetical protein